MNEIKLEYLGTYWPSSGELFYATSADGKQQARVFVDSLGETWVDIRRIPKGGHFHTERVKAYRVFSTEAELRSMLAPQYPHIATAPGAARVRQRGV